MPSAKGKRNLIPISTNMPSDRSKRNGIGMYVPSLRQTEAAWAAEVTRVVSITYLGATQTFIASPLFLPCRDDILVVELAYTGLLQYQQRAILKLERPEWKAEFEREPEIFATLREYQGIYLPHYYGAVRVTEADGSSRRGILLSYPESGQAISKMVEGNTVPREELEIRLMDAMKATVSLGVVNANVDWNNTLWVNGRVQIIDWTGIMDPGQLDDSVSAAECTLRYVDGETIDFLRWYSLHLERCGVNFRKLGYQKFEELKEYEPPSFEPWLARMRACGWETPSSKL